MPKPTLHQVHLSEALPENAVKTPAGGMDKRVTEVGQVTESEDSSREGDTDQDLREQGRPESFRTRGRREGLSGNLTPSSIRLLTGQCAKSGGHWHYLWTPTWRNRVATRSPHARPLLASTRITTQDSEPQSPYSFFMSISACASESGKNDSY